MQTSWRNCHRDRTIGRDEREKEAKWMNGQATIFNIFGPSEMDWFQSVWHGVNLENNKQKVENKHTN